MTYIDAMRILLRGTCGINASLIERQTGISRWELRKLMQGDAQDVETLSLAALDNIGLFIFRQLNFDVVLSPEDYEV